MKFLFNNIIAMSLLAVCLTGCLGYTSKGNDLIGQAKKASNETPVICSNFNAADLSLGVMRNGIGSMSTEDQWFYVPNRADFEILQKASESGAIVKVTYNVIRATFCIPDHEITHVELVPN